MNYYIVLVNGRVSVAIPQMDPAFPEVPIEKRFAPEFLSKCVVVDENNVPPTGYIYDVETGTFLPPPEPEETLPIKPPPGVPTFEDRLTAVENALLELI